MSHVKTLLHEVKDAKRDTILAPLSMVGEVLMEVMIPYVTGWIIDRGISVGDMNRVWHYGGIMVVMALLSLMFGTLSGVFASSAATRFARNLRKSMYENIQTFSFSNIDKFSTAGLITRMTTDVTNVQNAYMMVIRMAVRAPIDPGHLVHHGRHHLQEDRSDVPDCPCGAGNWHGHPAEIDHAGVQAGL